MDSRRVAGYNPKAIGERSEGQVIAAFLRLGRAVLLPFGDNQRYDCVIEDGGKFSRVQCKTGRIKEGCVQFDCCSSSFHRGGTKRSYKGEVDYFAVYCPDNDTCYLIEVEACGNTKASLRLDPVKHGQIKNIRWAKDFVLR